LQRVAQEAENAVVGLFVIPGGR